MFGKDDIFLPGFSQSHTLFSSGVYEKQKSNQIRKKFKLDVNIKKIRRHVKRILIIYWGFFGDLLTTTPFLEAIRKGFPRAHISYVIGGTGDKEQPDSDPRKIFEHNPNVDKCIRSDASILTRLLTDEPYNFTIDLCGSRTSQLIAKASGAKVKLWGNFRPKIPYFLYSDCLSGQWRPFLKIPIRQNIYKKKDLYRGEPFLEVLRFLRLHFKGAFTPKIYLSREEIYF